jgi:hypothetical protein
MLVAPLRTVRAVPGRARVPLSTAAGAAALGLLVAVVRGPGVGPAPAARILHPPDGAVLGSPVPVVLASDGVELAPCGPAVACEGHLNVLVDRPCLPAGELVPSGSLRADDLGVHALPDGSRVLLLDLSPGEHTICAQLADGTRVAFGATSTVNVTVDHLVPRTSRSVVATVPRGAGTSGHDPTRSAPWPVSSSATASRTSP